MTIFANSRWRTAAILKITQSWIIRFRSNLVRWCKFPFRRNGQYLALFYFLLYTADLEIIARQFGVEVYLYADYSQMYVFVRPHATQPADERLLHCLDEISRCQSQSFKDTVHAQRLTQLSNSPITFCGQQIIPATSVRNLHVNVDSSLSFRTHVNRVVSICLHQLRRIKSSLKALPQETTKFLVNCFMVSRLDYCNSLLAGVPQSLSIDYSMSWMQPVFSGQACTCVRPTGQRSAFTTCATEDPVVMYMALHAWRQTTLGTALSVCQRGRCSRFSPVCGARRPHRPQSGDKVLSRPLTSSSLQITNRSFRYASPHLWSKLPISLRQPHASHSPDSFILSHLTSTSPLSPLSPSFNPSLFT